MRLNNITAGVIIALLVGDIAVHLGGMARPVKADAVPGVVRATEIDLVDNTGKTRSTWLLDQTGNPKLTLASAAGNVTISGGEVIMKANIEGGCGLSLRFNKANYWTEINPGGMSTGIAHTQLGTIGPESVAIEDTSHAYGLVATGLHKFK